jgi:hypothetical protein
MTSTNIKYQNLTNGLRIIVPSRRKYFISIVSIPFVLCWIFIELIIIPLMIYKNSANFLSSIMIFWLAGWTFMGILITRICIWQLIGKTILQFENDKLIIYKKWDLFYKSKSYEIFKLKDLHIINRDIESNRFFIRPNYLFTTKTKGIEFNYELKTVRMVDWLEYTDAENILETMKQQQLLVEKMERKTTLH